MNKEKSKKFRRAVVRYVYVVFSWIFKVLPPRITFAITNFLLIIAYTALGHMRKLSMQTLTMAFGKEKSLEELQQICRQCFDHLGRGAIELGVLTTRPKMIVERCYFDAGSRERLDAALKEGNGVLAVSAHFGNFPLMLLYLSQIGYPTHAIIRPSRDEIIEEYFQEARGRLGLKTIHSYPREVCVSQSIKALRSKELLVVLLDQNTGSKSGVYVDFFGRKSGTATGPIIFALRTGSPILPIFTVRDGDRHKLIVEPHFYLEKKETDEETIQYNVQKITDIIERYVRTYPSEWGWMHRRWKSKPKENQPNDDEGISVKG